MTSDQPRSSPPSPRTRNRPADYLTTIVEAIIVFTSLAYVVTGSVQSLITWESIAAVYLLAGFIVSSRRSVRGSDGDGRRGALGTLSWVFPLAASLAGINSAVLVMVTHAATEPTRDENILLAVTTSVGIILSWHLFHIGFAQIYENSQDRVPGEPGLVFPTQPSPTFIDFLYFSFTIGTSFATSDTTVKTGRMRWTVWFTASSASSTTPSSLPSRSRSSSVWRAFDRSFFSSRCWRPG